MEYTFKTPLISGKFLKRYKRFFVDVELPGGEVVTAHCANTGSMKGLLVEGATAWLTPVNEKKRKLKYSLEMLDVGTSLVGVNTSLPNKLIAQAARDNKIPELGNITDVKTEVKYGTNSRIDVLVNGNHYVEIKNTTLRTGNAASFPDAVTARGLKHLHDLEREVKNGNKATIFFLTQRMDCDHFVPADEIDPAYGKSLRKVVNNGVQAVCYSCVLDENAIKLDKPLKVKL